MASDFGTYLVLAMASRRRFEGIAALAGTMGMQLQSGFSSFARRRPYELPQKSGHVWARAGGRKRSLPVTPRRRFNSQKRRSVVTARCKGVGGWRRTSLKSAEKKKQKNKHGRRCESCNGFCNHSESRPRSEVCEVPRLASPSQRARGAAFASSPSGSAARLSPAPRPRCPRSRSMR